MDNKIGIALSGGGYRATLFALGSLIRLNEEGLLYSIDTITSVSGGAITAGFLAYKWDELEFDEIDGTTGKVVATNFEEKITKPLVKFCNANIDIPSALTGLISLKSSIGDKIEKKYDELLFNKTLLSNVANRPGAPEFIYYGTNYDTGVSVRITKEYFRDYRIGRATAHDISIAQAVCVSSSFPPFFSPIILDGSSWRWQKTQYSDLYHVEELRERLSLCDGGLYDNMGIEHLWKSGKSRIFSTVFVCDAGAPLQTPYKYSDSIFGKVKSLVNWRNNWIAQFMRMSDIMISQQRALRKRWLMNNFISDDEYDGAYWGIDVNIDEYPVTPIVTYEKQYQLMKDLPTQLRPFKTSDVDTLINWSYALADAAIRGRYDGKITAGKLPRHKKESENSKLTSVSSR